MFKLAAAVIDFYDDPEFTKEAELFNGALVSPDKACTLQDRDFAVKIATAAGEHRKFPIYNRMATAISGRYFDKIACELPELIRKTAGYYLRDAHEQFHLDLPASLRGSFSPPEGRTILFEYQKDEGGINAGEDVVKLAEEIFADQFNAMSVLDRVVRAADILKAAEVNETNISQQEVWDYAPKDFYGPFVEEGLEQRETLVRGDGVLKEAYAKVLGEFAKMSSREAPFLLYHFDKIAGFDDRYRDGILDPFYAAWGGVPVVEKRADAAVELNYKLGTIARNDLLRGILGEGPAAEFVRHPIGAYERWAAEKPEWKALVDSLLKNVPAEKAPEAEASGLKKAVSKARAKMEKPSERPGSVAVGEQVAQAKIDAGL